MPLNSYACAYITCENWAQGIAEDVNFSHLIPGNFAQFMTMREKQRIPQLLLAKILAALICTLTV